jgi:hypothetical protein
MVIVRIIEIRAPQKYVAFVKRLHCGCFGHDVSLALLFLANIDIRYSGGFAKLQYELVSAIFNALVKHHRVERIVRIFELPGMVKSLVILISLLLSDLEKLELS